LRRDANRRAQRSAETAIRQTGEAQIMIFSE
jgi:hypothetical protein